MKKILLISGHKEKDNYSKVTKVYEGRINIDLIERIACKLKPYATVVVYPTDRDYYKDNKKGIVASDYNFSKYDYIYEQHANAGGGTGTSCQIHSNYKKGTSVEKLISHNLSKLGLKLRGTDGIIRRNDLLNMNTALRKGVDYCLNEAFFYDNPKDLAIYQSNPDAMATAIANGIIDGFGLTVVNHQQGTVSNCHTLNVRRTPNGEVAFTIPSGTVVTKIGEDKDSDGDSWDRITCKKGSGYVWGKYISY